jgi:cell division protein FtsL
MVVNFKVYEINRDTGKLNTHVNKKKTNNIFISTFSIRNLLNNSFFIIF